MSGNYVQDFKELSGTARSELANSGRAPEEGHAETEHSAVGGA